MKNLFKLNCFRKNGYWIRKLNSFYFKKNEQKEKQKKIKQKRERKELYLLSKTYKLERDFLTPKLKKRFYNRILYLRKKNEKN